MASRKRVFDPYSSQEWSWSEVSEMIKEKFPANKTLIFGAELHLNSDTVVSGCVSIVTSSLTPPNKFIERDACYIEGR